MGHLQCIVSSCDRFPEATASLFSIYDSWLFTFSGLSSEIVEQFNII